jgi:RNA polymerase sigma-70 factor (ECF subfamily)
MDGEPDPDIELLRRWQVGEAAAGNRLCQQYEATLRRFFATKVPPQEVDELVQQTWLAMSRARESLKVDEAVASADQARKLGNFRCYLFGIARHMVLGFYKGRRLAGAAAFDPEVESLATLEPSISRQLSLHRHLEWVELALQSLPLELQLLFEGHYLESLSGAELARTLGVPEGTIRSRLRKARQLLNETIDRLKTGASPRPS